MRLVWKPLAIQDRERIMNTIARDNPAAAIALDEEVAAAVLKHWRGRPLVDQNRLTKCVLMCIVRAWTARHSSSD